MISCQPSRRSIITLEDSTLAATIQNVYNWSGHILTVIFFEPLCLAWHSWRLSLDLHQSFEKHLSFQTQEGILYYFSLLIRDSLQVECFLVDDDKKPINFPIWYFANCIGRPNVLVFWYFNAYGVSFLATHISYLIKINWPTFDQTLSAFCFPIIK